MTTQDVPTLYTKDDTSGEYAEYTPPNPPAFKDTLPEDLRDTDHFADVSDLSTLAKSYVDLKSSLPVVPETADGYEITAPEGITHDEKIVSGFRQAAHELKLTQEQVNGLLAFDGQIGAQFAESVKQAREAAETELKTDWGADYEKNKEFASKVIRHFAGDEEAEKKLSATGFCDDPNVLRLFCKIGQAISEDVFVNADKQHQAGDIKRSEDGRPMLAYPSMQKK